MYDDIIIKWSYEEVTGYVKQGIGVRQGCSLSPYLFNIFIDNIRSIISEEKTHPPLVGIQMIPTLLFANYLAVRSSTHQWFTKMDRSDSEIL
jgi:hypothetical protein